MKSPKFVNLQTDAELAALGWAAVARDDDGHAMNVHAPFNSIEERQRYIGEAAEEGWHITYLTAKAGKARE